MDNVGDIRKGTEIGYKSSAKYIWHACMDCGKERWVAIIKGKPESKICLHCANVKSGFAIKGKGSCQWEGGRISRKGYTLIKLYSDDFFYSMASKDNYVREHRLAMAKHLGRCLLRQEEVHHKNGIRDDNRIENLELMPNTGAHSKLSTCSNCELRKEIRLLRLQIGLLREQLQGKLV